MSTRYQSQGDGTTRPRFEIGVTPTGNGVRRDLLINGIKVGEFANKAELIDLLMQGTSTLRYD